MPDWNEIKIRKNCTLTCPSGVVINIKKKKKNPLAHQQCWPESFYEPGKFLWHVYYWLDNFQVILKMSGWYTKYPDKMSGWSGKCLDDLKSVCMIWKVARQSKINLDNLENVPGWYGKCPDDLKSVWITVLNFACIQLKCSSANSFPYKCTQWSIFGPFLCFRSCKRTFSAHLSSIWNLLRFSRFVQKVFATKILLP